MKRVGVGVAALVAMVCGAAAWGQIIIGPRPIVSGVAIDANGVISHRTDDSSNSLDAMRKRLKEPDAIARLKCVSLPKVLAQAQQLMAAGKPLPEEMLYLGGLTRIDYVFLYPEQHDLVIAGPAEEWTLADTLEPVGKTTGRPVMQLFDFVTAMRTVAGHGRDFFGCSIDMPPNAGQISDDVAKKYGSRPPSEIVAQMKKAMGMQKIRVIGTAENTRLALAMVAADYQLKRFTMGLEKTPVELGNAVDASRGSGNRFWFAPKYDPLAVSEDGNAYALSGPRLEVKAGVQMFETKGVTDKAKVFTEAFNKKMPDLVRVEPTMADLQNIADLAVVAALIQHDGLDKKAGWDTSWCMDPKGCVVPVVPAPKETETVAAVVGNAVASGGVGFSICPFVGSDSRQKASAGAMPAAPATLDKDWQQWMGAAK